MKYLFIDGYAHYFKNADALDAFLKKREPKEKKQTNKRKKK